MSKQIEKSTALKDNREVKKKIGRNKNAMLDIKTKLFCRRYVENGFNGTKTYKEVYKVKNTGVAKTKASYLLTNVDIRKYIVGLLPEDDLKEQSIINQAFNSEKPKNINWRDIHKFIRTSLELKGKLNKDKHNDIKIGLVINK